MTDIYHYDHQELYTFSSIAKMSPREPNVPLVPRNATLIQPSAPPQNMIAQFASQNWSMVYDYRSFHYFTETAGEVTIEEINTVPPQGHTEIMPGEEVMLGENGLWKIMESEDYLDKYKDKKISELETSFATEFKAGLMSDALGSAHKYDTEQHNIDWFQVCVAMSISVHSVLPSITCDDLQENKSSKMMRTHNSIQCGILLLDSYNFTYDKKVKFRSLRDDVYDAEDEASVDLVVW